MLVMAEKMNESAVLRMPILFSLVNPSTKGSILPTISPHCCSVCITRWASGASGQLAKAGVSHAAGYHLSSNLRNHVGYSALKFITGYDRVTESSVSTFLETPNWSVSQFQ